jgi:hypothetical protein
VVAGRDEKDEKAAEIAQRSRRGRKGGRIISLMSQGEMEARHREHDARGRGGGKWERHTLVLLTRATIMGRSAVGSRRCISCRCCGGKLLSLYMSVLVVE